MTLKRLRLLALGSLLGFVVFVEVTRRSFAPYFATPGGPLVMDLLLAVGLLVLFGLAFEVLAKMHGRVERQNRELVALQEASLDIRGELALDAVLQKVVERAVRLLDARYGALSVLDAGHRILAFVTTGLTDAEKSQIGAPPQGRGVLGIPLGHGQRIRTADVRVHASAVGFPSNHPAMTSLLAVPIPCPGPFRGNLYLADKRGDAEFSAEDEETLVRFAATAAVAIDNSHLHERLRSLAVAEERLRIAHEMHDGMAQVLAYVNAKAQAAQEHLKRGRTAEAETQLDQMAAAAREVYSDVREGILGLRSGLGGHGTLAETLRSYVERWQEQCGTEAEIEIEEGFELSPPLELQLVRIVQESLANVRKHARAERVGIRVERAAGAIRLRIEDDGVGFEPAALGRSAFPRFGLATMRERAESVGGILLLESAPAKGTRITVDFPPVPRMAEGGSLENPDR